MVLADGSIVIASEEENSDLYFAVKAGANNFGWCPRPHVQHVAYDRQALLRISYRGRTHSVRYGEVP